MHPSLRSKDELVIGTNAGLLITEVRLLILVFISVLILVFVTLTIAKKGFGGLENLFFPFWYDPGTDVKIRYILRGPPKLLLRLLIRIGRFGRLEIPWFLFWYDPRTNVKIRYIPLFPFRYDSGTNVKIRSILRAAPKLLPRHNLATSTRIVRPNIDIDMDIAHFGQ